MMCKGEMCLDYFSFKIINKKYTYHLVQQTGLLPNQIYL